MLDAVTRPRVVELSIIETLAALTGLRRGRIFGLRWEDCDLDRPTFAKPDGTPRDPDLVTKGMAGL